MSQFDVYPHPDPASRRATPFLLDVQNNPINGLATRLVVPLRAANLVAQPLRDLNPVFEIAGKAVVLDTPALATWTSWRSAVLLLCCQSSQQIDFGMV